MNSFFVKKHACYCTLLTRNFYLYLVNKLLIISFLMLLFQVHGQEPDTIPLSKTEISDSAYLRLIEARRQEMAKYDTTAIRQRIVDSILQTMDSTMTRTKLEALRIENEALQKVLGEYMSKLDSLRQLNEQLYLEQKGVNVKLSGPLDTIEIRVKNPNLDYVLGDQKAVLIWNGQKLKKANQIQDTLSTYFEESRKGAVILRLCSKKGILRYMGMWREEGFIDEVIEFDIQGMVANIYTRETERWVEKKR